MAGSKTLNPQAPAYIPLSYERNPYTHYYYSPPPLPLYTTPYSIPPPHPNLLPPPPPAEHSQEVGRQVVVTESVRYRPPRRPRGFGRGGFCNGGGNRVGFGRRHKESNFSRRPFGNGDRNVETRAWLNKHEVLPIRRSEGKTTVMIKNIPKEYNRELLLKFLDEHCMLENQKTEDAIASAFDFLYLPIDFRSGCNKGYAFVNFTNPRAVRKFYHACNKKTWDFFQSPKIREIVCALIQGKEALVKHFEKSTFCCGSDEFLPVCFSPPRDGSGEPVKETTIGKRIGEILQYSATHRITKI